MKIYIGISVYLRINELAFTARHITAPRNMHE